MQLFTAAVGQKCRVGKLLYKRIASHFDISKENVLAIYGEIPVAPMLIR